MMKTWLLLLSFCWCAGVAHAETRDPLQYFFDQKLGDFKSDLAAAKQEGKTGVLLMFEQEDCPWCHRMKTTVLNQSDVQAYFKKYFSIFEVDIKGSTALIDFKGKETTEKDFSFEHRVRATPVLAFFDLDGNLIYRFTGATKDVKEFLLLGRYVVEGHYKSQAFNVFKQGAQ